MKKNQKIIILICLISGIKGFICGIKEQIEESLKDIKHAIKQNKTN